MLNKNTMQTFAEQFISGKVKLKKNKPIHGKNDTYYAEKEGIFISFEDKEIVVKVPNINIFLDNCTSLTPKVSNYMKAVETMIKIENNFRGDDVRRQLDGQVYTEITFKIRNKEISLDVFTLVSYYSIKQVRTSFGHIFYEMPFFSRDRSELIIKAETNQKMLCDFDMFKSDYASEILNFECFLDDAFNDQLNTLEMALL